MAWVAVAAAATTVVGNKVLNGKQSGTQTTTQQQQLDPRIGNIVFGENGNDGLLSQFQSMLPQSAGMQSYQQAGNDYLANYGAGDMSAIHGAATGLLGGATAPQTPTALMGAATASLPAYAVGNMVNAPRQNNIDLTDSYQNLLSGGDTSKLMNSLQAGNALAGAQFQKNQSDLTDNLQRNILPGIRSNSVLAGQYGGSRQGVAEGLAVSDLTKQLNNSNTQFGLGATAANSSALAGAYENGQNRALSATQGLGAQQYGVAQQDAATKNQAEFMNVGNSFDASKTNASLLQQANLANLGTTAQANLANQQAQLTTNAQNNGAALGGAGLLGGLMSSATGAANSDLARAQGVNGLLVPYLSANQSATTSQPIYQNQAGGILGGALLGSQLKGLFSTDYNSIRNTDNYGANVGNPNVFNVPSSVGNFSI